MHSRQAIAAGIHSSCSSARLERIHLLTDHVTGTSGRSAGVFPRGADPPQVLSGNEWCSCVTSQCPRSLRSPMVRRKRLSGSFQFLLGSAAQQRVRESDIITRGDDERDDLKRGAQARWSQPNALIRR